jgi:hypothetical protein
MQCLGIGIGLINGVEATEVLSGVAIACDCPASGEDRRQQRFPAVEVDADRAHRRDRAVRILHHQAIVEIDISRLIVLLHQRLILPHHDFSRIRLREAFARDGERFSHGGLFNP